ncbi:hypothetical protein AB1L88_09150 [Tautonia sp. JC769]|uniref:hypothetical protein n=1 Tax=Tautonia sp. JC769 TaxID=3232135 RepID=UPI003459E209
MTIKISWAIFWGYAVEVIGTAAMYGLARVFVSIEQLSAFIQSTWAEWNDLTGILFSAALAVWLTFINIRGSLFGDYLARKQDDRVYSRAFLTAMIAFFFATAALNMVGGIKNDIMAHAAFILLIYSTFNLFSMMKNATDLIRLYSAFKKQVEIERIKMEMQQPEGVAESN